MKTNSQELQLIWDDLQDIFKDFRQLSHKHIERLEKLGFEVVYQGKHPKIYIWRNGIRQCVTFCSTPSDRYAGKQILRQIRRIYEN